MKKTRQKKLAQKARICKRPIIFILDEAGFVENGRVVYLASPMRMRSTK